MTREQFEALGPKERGFVVYMLGCIEDEPNVLDEKNPYSPDSLSANAWDRGQREAVQLVQDNS